MRAFLRALSFRMLALALILTLLAVPQALAATKYATLEFGSRGSDVLKLQKALLELGFNPNGTDGKFGRGTETAVKAYQAARGLEVDGKYGEKSHAALMDAAADGGKDSQPVQPEPPDAEETPVSGTVVIVSDGGKVNIREGNGLTYGRITQLAPGTTCPYVATAENGWHAVVIGSRVGWVAGEFSRIV